MFLYHSHVVRGFASFRRKSFRVCQASSMGFKSGVSGAGFTQFIPLNEMKTASALDHCPGRMDDQIHNNGAACSLIMIFSKKCLTMIPSKMTIAPTPYQEITP
ncbi:hypothetical protein ILYODFUR_023376 [Ilyodon furcidens]|uniref:Uncharacterized protein n=1 Tax=Ilyodon furcidens TaxID=33524 RepID=A0ABV0VHH9_9TELE